MSIVTTAAADDALAQEGPNMHTCSFFIHLLQNPQSTVCFSPFGAQPFATQLVDLYDSLPWKPSQICTEVGFISILGNPQSS